MVNIILHGELWLLEEGTGNRHMRTALRTVSRMSEGVEFGILSSHHFLFSESTPSIVSLHERDVV